MGAAYLYARWRSKETDRPEEDNGSRIVAMDTPLFRHVMQVRPLKLKM